MFLSAFVVMTIVDHYISVIEQFFGAMIAHFTMTVLLVVIVVNLHHRANYGGRPPIWVRRLVLQRMSRFFKMQLIASQNEVSQDSFLIPD